MPSFIVMESAGRTGEMINATLCDPNPVTGYPDKSTAVPVKATMISEKSVRIDDEPRPRAIISAISENGTATILVGGSTRGLQNRARRAALAKAQALLLQLGTCLRPLRQESEQPELVTEGLGLLQNWLSDERESATTAPRPETTSSRDEVSK